MPLYGYRCRLCGHELDAFFARDDKPGTMGACPNCSRGELRPVFSLHIAPVMQAHYNPAVDGEVTGMRDFKDKLKRASEQHSLRTGLDCSFVPAERESLGATDEGLESTNRLRRDRGLPPVSNLS